MRVRLVAACVSILTVGRPELALAELIEEPRQDSTAPAAATAAPKLPPPDLRPRVYVKDLDHLAQLVKEDAAVEAQAQALATRRTAALGVGGVLFASGLVVALTGLGNQNCHDSTPFPGAGTMRICETDPTQTAIGAGIAAAGALAAMVISPKPGDLLDVINGWNTAHPDRPFELSGGREPLLEQAVSPTTGEQKCTFNTDCPGGSCSFGTCSPFPPPSPAPAMGGLCNMGTNCNNGICMGPDCQ